MLSRHALYGLLLVVWLGESVQARNIRYVDDDAMSGGNGLLWFTAYNDLQDALTEALSDPTITEIRVAGGTYVPSVQAELGTPRTEAYQLIKGVTLAGGYRGCPGGDCLSGNPNERSVALYESILTGDLAGDDTAVACTQDSPDCDFHGGRCVDGFCIVKNNTDENCYHVFYHTEGLNLDETAIIDGFTITTGNADGAGASDSGGGMYNDGSDPTVTNCRFAGNSAEFGGGMCNDDGNPTVTNCTFSANLADFGGGIYNYRGSAKVAGCTLIENSADKGGGMYNGSSEPRVTECTFIKNSASARGGGMCNSHSVSRVTNCTFTGNSSGWCGGGMDNYTGRPAVSNCTFNGNSAADYGGGMRNLESSPVVINCTFSENSAARSGGGVYSGYNSNPTVTNCILWGNSDANGHVRNSQVFDTGDSLTTITYSCVQDAVAHDGDVYPGLGNVDTAPLFVDPMGPDGIPGTEDEDLSLLPRSPCIDAADNTAVPADMDDLDDDGDTDEPLPVDAFGHLRFIDDPCLADVGNPDLSHPYLGIVDVGACEYQGDAPGDPDGDGLQGCTDNCPLHANLDQADCDGDGLGDYCAIELGASRDCNDNEIPDECDICDGASTDLDGDGVPDECGRVYYVDDDAPLGGDGLAWTTAFAYLQDALTVAYSGDEIHVAAGTSTPDLSEDGSVLPGDREATFLLISGVALRGGYRGCPGGVCGAGNPDERDIALYETVLSGDLAGGDVQVASPADLLDEPTRAENSYTVITGGGTDQTAVLDGFTIAGATDSGMYNVFSSPTVKNCIFTGNSAEGYGGGMYNESSTPTVTDCAFIANFAESSGGGMDNYDGSCPIITTCTFADNIANEYGGGIYNNGCDDLRVTNCTFTRNTSYYAGGGIYDRLYSSSTVTNCTFSHNTAGEKGGGMYTDRGRSRVTNCTFNDNLAEYRGAGMHVATGSSTVTNCTFRANSTRVGGGISISSSDHSLLENCTFTGNVATQQGGAIHIGNALDLLVTDCTFVANTASSGGGMYNDSWSMTVANCVFSGNSAQEGGGMYNDRSYSTLVNCTFSGNAADKGGALVNYDYSEPVLRNCIVWGNTLDEISNAPDSSVDVEHSCVRGWQTEGSNIAVDPLFVDSGYWDDGGTPSDPEDDFWIDGDYHLDASSPCINAGDDSAVPVGVITDFDGDDRIQQCRVDMGADETPHIGPDCNENGLADACDIEQGSSTDCNVSGIPDECEPGGLEDCNGNETSDLCDIHLGTSRDCNGNAVPDECEILHVGRVYVDGGAVDGGDDGTSWGDAYLELYSALDYAVCVDGGVTEIWVAQGTYMPDITRGEDPRRASLGLVNGVTVYGGFPDGGGDGTFEARDPAIYKTILSGDIGIAGDASDNCYHVFYHPEGLNLDETAVLDGVTITGGNAEVLDYSDYTHSRGGGMYNYQNSPTVINCTFSENSAEFFGGGMYNDDSHPTVTSCTFIQNSAEKGGGGMCNGGSSSSAVIDCTFKGNAAGDSGGGMYNGSSKPTVTRCAFAGNSAGSEGGGMRNNFSDTTVMNSTFTGNSAGRYGGGMYNNQSGATLMNCALIGNLAADYGGGMRNNLSEPTVTNCILWGNWAGYGPQIHGGGTFMYCDIQDDEPDDGLVYPGTGNISADPLLADPGYWDDNGTPDAGDDDFWVDGDYHLLPASPCINAGDNTVVPDDMTTDFDGDERIQQCRVDMGADETPHFTSDCNENGTSDACDIANGTSHDCNANHVPDDCEVGGLEDCNINGTSDLCDIHSGISYDCNINAVPDECEVLPVGTLYVDGGDLDGSDDGSSWTDAYLDLDLALFHAACAKNNVTEVRVAEGTYTPDTARVEDPRGASLQLVNGVTVYGGFPAGGGDGTFEARDPAEYETIISGDLRENDVSNLAEALPCFSGKGNACDPGCETFDSDADGDVDCADLGTCDNAYHVFWHPEELVLDKTAALDGFTVTSGNADGGSSYRDESGSGGGMYNENSNPTVTNCTFRANAAKYRGGGMYNEGSSPTVTNCTFSRNLSPGDNSSRGGYGAGMHNYGNSNPMVMNCTFSDNSARYGGGVYNEGGRPTVSTCLFAGNTGRRGGGMGNLGGGSPAVTNCEFIGNSADQTGGGISSDEYSNPVVTDCTFSENSARFGGALYSARSTPTVASSTFRANSAWQGGGIYEYDRGMTLTNCTLSDNSAEYGGGMVTKSHSNPTLTSCTFSGNSAVDGGGIYSYHYSDPTVVNCTFSGNIALNGRTLACDSNRQEGPSDVLLSNCILWNGGEEIWNYDDSRITITYSDVQDDEPDDGIVYPGAGNVDMDPLFVDPGGWDDNGTPADPDDDFWVDGDYHLQASSPCINAGNDAAVPEGITTDLDGHARILCGQVDIGAYEFGIGDYDCNMIVELMDFAAWDACMTGPDGGPFDTGCEAFDFEADAIGDIDLRDFAGFQLTLAGE